MNTDIRAIATLQQAPPTQNDRPSAHDLLVEVVQERKKLGLERHKAPLQPYNGRDQMVDVLQELVDGSAYLINAIQERDDLLRKVERLEALADLVKAMIQEAEMEKLPAGPVDLFVDVRWFRDLQSAIAQLEGQ